MNIIYRLKILLHTYKICSHKARREIYNQLTADDLDKIIQGANK